MMQKGASMQVRVWGGGGQMRMHGGVRAVDRC